MARDLLREYLIALGFNIKDDEYKKFRDAVTRAGKDVVAIGEAALSSSLAIGYMVEKASRQFETLYYVSQRTGQSVAYLKAYEFAARQVGVSQDQARASTEAFFATLRTNPAGQALLKTLGVGANGTPVDLVGALKQRFGEGGYFIAARFAQQFGLDEQTFRQYWTNLDRLRAAQESQRRRQEEAGVATHESTEKFLAFSRALNQLEEDFDNLKTRIGQDFVEPAKWVVEKVDDIIQAFNRLDKATGGAAGVAGTIAMSALAGVIFKRVMGRVLVALGLRAAPAAVAGTAATAAEAGTAATAAEAAGGFLLRRFLPLVMLQGNISDQESADLAKYRQSHSRQSGNTRGDRNNNPGNIEYGPFAIAHGAIGTDGRFAIFPSPEVGAAAMDALLKTSGYHGLTLAQLQRKWVGNSDPAYLAGMSRATGLGPNDVVNVDDPRVRRGLMSGMSSGEGTHLAPSPLAATGGNITINHDTDINIAGGPTSKATADLVADAQEGVYARAVRDNLSRVR